MKRKLPYVFTILIISFVFSCSELQDQIPQAPDLSIHGEGVMNPSSSNFHGNYLAGNQKGFVSCYQCHSTDLSGGSAEVSCVNCHNSVRVHKEGINNPNSQDFHGKFIANNSWNLNDCKICHGSNYSGGKVSPSCLSCHAYKNGPEQCNTCHGSFSDTTRIAPPTALDGSSSTTSAGVGAHTSHLYDNNLGSSILCSTCHKVPQNLNDANHLDGDGKAELVFSGLANNGGANSSYNFNSTTCSNIYCHGNFEFQKDSSAYPFIYIESSIKGNNVSANWTVVDGTQSACGTCHGLPPTGHVPTDITSCGNCHTGVVNAQGEIIDRSKHINGVINVFGN